MIANYDFLQINEDKILYYDDEKENLRDKIGFFTTIVYPFYKMLKYGESLMDCKRRN